MPIYEYQCSACGHEFEEMTSIAHRDDQHPCPQCSAQRAERKCSVVAAGRTEAPVASHHGGCGHCCGSGHCSGGNG